MTDEQINIAIAESLGLFRLEPLRRTTRKGNKSPNGVVLWYCEEHFGGARTWGRVPDYCKDLNAMHEVEKTLASAQAQRDFADWLDDGNGGHFATARQRAEAYLRTIGKWVEVTDTAKELSRKYTSAVSRMQALEISDKVGCEMIAKLTAERDALLARIYRAANHLENPSTLAEKKARIALTEIVHGGAK